MLTSLSERILYEDNHLILINKLPGEIVQADKTGDITLADDVKHYLKVRYNKPGNVFLGLPHRLDRPTSGIVVFARTDKALSRLSEMFRTGKIEKHYWAITDKQLPSESGELCHYLYRDAQKNKSFAYSPAPDGGKPALRGVCPDDLQLARLQYRQIGQSERYELYDINLLTGGTIRSGPSLPPAGCISRETSSTASRVPISTAVSVFTPTRHCSLIR